MPTVSDRGQNVVASPIRKFFPLIEDAEKRGIKVYKLNVGDPDLFVPTPFFDELKNYKSKNLPYAPSSGVGEHITAWQEYYKQFGVELEPENIIPTIGCAEAISLALLASADNGDEILVFEPLYVSYKSLSVMAGIKLVPITLKTNNNFAIPIPAFIESKITPKTKAIIIINPDNPTGKLWTGIEITSILNIAKKHDLFIIADETYREIRFEGRPSCILTNKNAKENMILIDSVSKRFSMPGSRIGCIVSYNKKIMNIILKFAQARLSAGTLEQYALIPLLENSRKYTEPVCLEYKKRCEMVYQMLSKIKNVFVNRPFGAFYIYAALPVDSAEEFVKFMIKDFSFNNETVIVSPMSDFYITTGLGNNEIRIACVLDTKDLKRSMEILEEGLKVYQNKKP